MMMLMDAKAVFFDLDGLLLAAPAEPDTALHMAGFRLAYEYLRGLGIELPPFQQSFKMVFSRLAAARIGLAFGNLREIDIEKEVSALLASAAPALGAAGAARAIDEWFRPFGAALAFRGSSAAVLARLRGAGLALGAGINSPWPRRLVEGALAASPAAGLLDFVAVSSEIGLRRPNLFFFESALKSMGLRGPETVYVGCSGADGFEAAEEKLMTTVGVGPDPQQGWGPRFSVAGLESVPDLVLKIAGGGPA